MSVQEAAVAIIELPEGAYISLTDMAKAFEGVDLIYSWMRVHATLEYLGAWEVIHNPEFKGGVYETFKAEAGPNTFHMSPRKWIEGTNAIGIYSKAGRAGGTYAHQDIALEFATWLSPVFKLHLIKEFQRLQAIEAERRSEEWQLNRALSKLNYRLHTSAIQQHLIPPAISKRQAGMTYATEADLLNMAVFGQTAKEWRQANPGHSGNMRDDASIPQLLVLANLESQNALLIEMAVPQADRLQRLNQMAIQQLQALEADGRTRSLPGATAKDESN